MADNTINVQITADQAQLQAQLALAKDNLRAIQTEVSNLATTVNNQGTTAFTALNGKLIEFSEDLTKAQIEVTQLKTQLDASIETTLKAGEAHGHLQLATAGSTREFIVLGHELMQGNFSRIPGSLLVLTERMGSLHRITQALASPLGLLAAGAAIVAAGFAFLAIKAAEAGKEMLALQGIAAARGFDITKEQLETLKKSIEKIPGATSEMVNQIASEMLRMKTVTVAQWQAIIDLAPTVAALTGQKLPEAFKALGNAIPDPKKFKEIIDLLPQNSKAVIDFNNALDSGDNKRIAVAGLDALSAAAMRYNDTTHLSTEAAERQAGIVQGLSNTFAAAAGVEIDVVKASKDYKQTIDTIRTDNAVQQLKNLQTAETSIVDGPAIGKTIEQVKIEVLEIQAAWQGSKTKLIETEIQTWEARKKEGVRGATELGQFELEIGHLRVALNKEIGNEEVKTAHEKLAEIRADESKSATERLGAEIAVTRALVNNDKISSEERRTARIELLGETTRLANLDAQQQLKALEAVTAGSKRGSQERVDAAQEEVDFTVAKWKVGSDQYIAAQRHLTEALKEQIDQWNNEYDKGIKRQLASTALNEQQKLAVIQAALASIGAKTEQNEKVYEFLLDQEVTYERKAAAERVAIRQNAVQTEREIQKSVFAEKKAEFDIEVSLGRKTHQQMFDDLKTFSNQEYALQRQQLVNTLQGQAAGTAGAVKAYNAILVADRQHEAQISQITRQATQYQIQQYQELAQAILGPVGNAIQGLIFRTENLQQAVQSIFQSMVGFIIQKIEEWVTKWIISLIIGETATKTSALEQVVANAAIAGAAGTASAAAIPLIGWAIAPEAGMADFTAAMAFGPAAGLAVGAWDIPQDMMVQLHKGEQVVPQTYADGARAAGGTASSGNNYAITIHAMDARSVKQLFMDEGSTLVASLKKQQRNGNT